VANVLGLKFPRSVISGISIGLVCSNNIIIYLCSPVPGGGEGGLHLANTLLSELSEPLQFTTSQCKKDFADASGSQHIIEYSVGGVGGVHTGYGSWAVSYIVYTGPSSRAFKLGWNRTLKSNPAFPIIGGASEPSNKGREGSPPPDCNIFLTFLNIGCSSTSGVAPGCCLEGSSAFFVRPPLRCFPLLRIFFV
jgi:hypothetical protein